MGANNTNDTTMLIGLSGYARSGKSTVATILENEGWAHTWVSKALKQMVWALNPYIGTKIRYQDIVTDPLNDQILDVAKSHPRFGEEIRRLLQYMGGEASRPILGENVWADHMMKEVNQWLTENRKVVVSSVRYPEEAKLIVGAGGQIWRIERPGCKPVNNHPGETAMDDYLFDHIIHNNGTVEQLKSCVLETLRTIN